MRAFLIVFSLILTLSSGFAYAQESKDPSPAMTTQSVTNGSVDASVESLTAKDAVADSKTVFEARDSLAEYVDRYATDIMDILVWVMGIFGALVTLFLAAAGYVFKRYLEDTRASVERVTEQKVFELLKEEGQSQKTFSRIVEELKLSDERFESVLASLRARNDQLGLNQGAQKTLSPGKVQENNHDLGFAGDPSFAYEMASELSDKLRTNSTGEFSDRQRERNEAERLLNEVLFAALDGRVDPNTVFNSAATAGKFDFDDLALKLQTMAYHLSPTPSHQLAMLDNEHNLGRGYIFESGVLKDKGLEPREARKAAFVSALKTVEKGVRPQSEIILSRSWNMAERGREDGAYDALIKSVQKGIDAADEGTLAASYYYVTLFQLLARRANSGWKDEALAAAQKAVDALAQESPLATWYGSSVRELVTFSRRCGLEVEVKAMFEAKGITAFDDASQGPTATQMMQLIAQLQARSAKGKPADDEGEDA